MRRTFGGLVALVVAVTVAVPARAEDSKPRPVLVFAASSLAEAFTALGDAFAQTHAPASVEQNFAGSPALVAQIESGAPAEVIATADFASLDELAQGGLLEGPPAVFAHNRLEIAVERGNPKGVHALADLARTDLVLVLAAETVPAGRYAREALRGAGVRAEPRSLEENVKSVLSKVALGEADAGIVYVTDVRAEGGRVSGVEIPEAQNVVASYPIALVNHPGSRDEARAFIAFVLSRDGQGILARFGFLPP